jgi:HSP20 family protein
MATTTDVASRPSTDVQSQAQSRTQERILIPPVDICESDDGITLMADMPGVSRDQISIQVDKNTLTIEGNAQLDMPEGIQALYADVRSTRYRRSFALSGELQAENIDANLNNGVLTLRIPKRPELKPRRIEVRTH